MRKTFLTISLFLLVITFYKLLAQTNDMSPELRKAMKEADARLQFYLTNECPIHVVVRISQGNIYVLQGKTACEISYLGHTNMVVYVPIPEQQFDFHLFSEDGKEIPKISGYKFSRALKPDPALINGSFQADDPYSDSYTDNIYERRLDFKNGNHSHFWRFEILKSFQIGKPGEYRLQVEVRLFTKDTNGVFQPFILPPVETKVNISENDIGK